MPSVRVLWVHNEMAHLGINEKLAKSVKSVLQSRKDKSKACSKVKAFVEKDNITEAELESTLRFVFQENIQVSLGVQHPFEESPCASLLELALYLSQNELVDDSVLLHLYEDAFDSCPIFRCQSIFVLFLQTVNAIFSEAYDWADKSSGKTKLAFLRVCNGLLKRSSSTEFAEFRGRILALMAFTFPLDERSGVNVRGTFNVQSEIIYDLSEEDKRLVEENSEDYKFYQTFWGLQVFFSNPKAVEDVAKGKRFIRDVQAVLDGFQNNPLVSLNNNSGVRKQSLHLRHLKSPRLFLLQLSDAQFRREIIVQMMIVLQYLQFSVSSKKLQLKMSFPSSILKVFSDLYDRCVSLLKITPQCKESEFFAHQIQEFLSAESIWVSWKDNNCPPIARTPINLKVPIQIELPEKQDFKKKRPGSFNLVSSESLYGKLVPFGTEELKRVFKVKGEIEEILKENSRTNFMEPLQEYEEILMEDEREEDLDPKDKRMNDEKFLWKCLRALCSKKYELFQKCEGKLDVLVESLKEPRPSEQPPPKKQKMQEDA